MRLLVIFVLGAALAGADTLLIKSIDGGRTWTDIDPGPPYQVLYWLQVHPRNSTLYALAQANLKEEIHLLVSSDAGQSWQIRQKFPSGTYDLLPATPLSADTLYLAHEIPGPSPKSAVVIQDAGRADGPEQYSAAGLTIFWDSTYIGFFTGFAVDPFVPSKLYALITVERCCDDQIDALFQAFWRSDDAGRNWRRLAPPVTADCLYPQMQIDPSDASVYLGCGGLLLKTTDGGETWMKKLRSGEPINNLLIGPGVLYTFEWIDQQQRRLWRSTDGAETWQPSGYVPLEIGGELQVHPTNPSTIFGSGDRGVFKSENGGETWTELAEYQGEFHIRIDPRAPETVYAFSLERQEPRLNNRQTFLRDLLGGKQVAPGSLVSIYGGELASEIRIAESTPLPLSLAGASVSFNGVRAPLLFVSPNQINAQAPFELASLTGAFPPTTAAILEVRRANMTVDRQIVNISPQAVLILREGPLRESAPFLFHSSDFRRVTPQDPARRGEAITLFAVGMGELEPAIAAGELAPAPAPQVQSPPCVAFSQLSSAENLAGYLDVAPALWAGAAPGWVGVYQVNLKIPEVLGSGTYTLSLTDRGAKGTPACQLGNVETLDSAPIAVE